MARLSRSLSERTAAAALLALASCPVLLPAQTASRELDIRKVRTPDGSLFLLVPRRGRPVVHWASFVRMGSQHEPPDVPGLAEACALSSLAGGSSPSKQEAEEKALAELDRVWSKLVAARRRKTPTQEIEKLTSELERARARAHAFAAPELERLTFAALPALGPEIVTGADGTLLHAELPSNRVLEFAAFMDIRRRNAILRDFHKRLDEARKRRAIESEKPDQVYLRTACQRALLVHPLRLWSKPLPANPRFFSWQEAREFYRRHQRPDRTVTVLVGGFDPKRIEGGLRKIFVNAPGALNSEPAPVPEEPPQRGQNVTRLELAGARRLVLAYRVPVRTPQTALEVLTMLLGRGRSSRLTRRLVEEEGLAQGVRVLSRFPSFGDPSLFVIEISSTKQVGAYSELVSETLSLMTALRAEQISDGALWRSILSRRAERQRLAEDARLVATYLARLVAMRGEAALDEKEPDLDSLRSLIRELFAPSRLTLVQASADKRPHPKSGSSGGNKEGR